MNSEKTYAIVLRVIDFSETSCVVTLWTRDFGKLTALAKGARRPKNPFEAALDMLAICRVVFLHKSSGAMDLLTEAKLERRFRNASGNLNHLYAAYYVVELLRSLTEDNDPHPELYDLAIKTITQIDSQPDSRIDSKNNTNSVETNPANTKDNEDDQTTPTSPFNLSRCLLDFEMGALKILGHLPMLTKCVSCGRPRTTQNQVSFGLNDGGLICRTCRPGKTNVISLSHQAVNTMLAIASPKSPANSTSPAREPALAVSESKSNFQFAESHTDQYKSHHPTNQNLTSSDALGEIRSLMNRYLCHLLGFEPRTQKYIKNL